MDGFLKTLKPHSAAFCFEQFLLRQKKRLCIRKGALILDRVYCASKV
jgi:hypothetical protein